MVGQPYVFAEGTLQAHGFGWRVEGPVAGWAGAGCEPGPGRQHRGPGHRRAARDATAGQAEGPPERQPRELLSLRRTKIVLPPAPGTRARRGRFPIDHRRPHDVADDPEQTADTTTTADDEAPTTTPSRPPSRHRQAKPRPSAASRRPRAFVIAGRQAASRSTRFRCRHGHSRLNSWLDSHRHVSPANVSYWLYQQAWIVHRGQVRLVARSGGDRDADCRRQAGREALGSRLQERGRGAGGARVRARARRLISG